jgi:hypothetical protein
MRVCAGVRLRSGMQLGYATQYTFLATKQNSTIAIMPVHTPDEINHFRRMMLQFSSNAVEPNWRELSRLWCEQADGSRLFYKTPEHLRSYYLSWQETGVATSSVALNYDVVQPMRQQLIASSRIQEAPAPQLPVGVRLALPHNTEMTNLHPITVPEIVQSSPSNMPEARVLALRRRLAPLPVQLSAPLSLPLFAPPSTPIYLPFPLPLAHSPQSDMSTLRKRRKKARSCQVCGKDYCPGRAQRHRCLSVHLQQ